jgi:hypothetical protein
MRSLFKRCPLYTSKRTSGERIGMSAKCQIRTHAPQQKASLFDHLVSASPITRVIEWWIDRANDDLETDGSNVSITRLR